MCNIFTLTKFIEYADVKQFWTRAGLQEWLIPYILLATCDLPPPKSSKGVARRSTGFRCRFDARIRTAEDLWIRTEDDRGYIRAEYKNPARGAEPGPQHLIDVKVVVPDANFLARVAPGGNAYQIGQMRLAFPEELK